MNKIKEILFLNFSELQFDDNIEKCINETVGLPVKTIKLSVTLNLNGNCYQQIVNLIDGIRDELLKYEFIMICPPALSIAAIYIVNEIYATTNTLPYVLELEKIRNVEMINNILFDKGIYRLKRIRSLEKERFFTRRKLMSNKQNISKENEFGE